MKVIVQDECDGFCIIVDDERFYFNQEDTRKGLEYVIKKINPEAEVSYEEIY